MHDYKQDRSAATRDELRQCNWEQEVFTSLDVVDKENEVLQPNKFSWISL